MRLPLGISELVVVLGVLPGAPVQRVAVLESPGIELLLRRAFEILVAKALAHFALERGVNQPPCCGRLVCIALLSTFSGLSLLYITCLLHLY